MKPRSNTLGKIISQRITQIVSDLEQLNERTQTGGVNASAIRQIELKALELQNLAVMAKQCFLIDSYGIKTDPASVVLHYRRKTGEY